MMLAIRGEQMKVFEDAALRSFKEEMLTHLRDFSPPLFKTAGEAQMRAAIDLGISRAATYGFTFRGPVRLYLELMLLFGSHFDTDPQYPWAGQILVDLNFGSQMQRAEMLYEKTMDYREKVAGPEDNYSLDALRNIAVFAKTLIDIPQNNFAAFMLQEISQLYPQKVAYTGADALTALIRKGMEGAQRQRFGTARGAALVTVLMLGFGHGCGNDPLYPWIMKTLKDETITDPDARASRLEKRALTWLEHVLVNSNASRGLHEQK